MIAHSVQNQLDNVRKAIAVFRREGTEGVAERLVRRAAKRWGGDAEPMFLRPGDVVDPATVQRPPTRALPGHGTRLVIGWVLTAPGPASGGHTTIFRFVQALEAAGHRCVLYVYDGQGGDASAYLELIRTWWPLVKADVRNVSDLGSEPVDALIATAWPTAHILAASSRVSAVRFYLVQDFEPYFYPRGSAYELAEATYRFGFIPLTVGHMVAGELKARFECEPIVAEFGCDREKYHVIHSDARDAVVFYAKPGVARRGYELALMALALFHDEHPEVEIHTFGIEARRLTFPATVHAHMAPHLLNGLYNRCAAGLALSFTNISLVAFELLAAGVVPVVNDSVWARADLDNPHVAWAQPTPRSLASSLAQALEHHREFGPDAIAQSVAEVSWDPARSTVVDAIERECTHAASPEPKLSYPAALTVRAIALEVGQ